MEIEDIFDIHNVLIKAGYSVEEARNIQRHMLNRFWSGRFVKFSLLSRFRPGVRKCINNLRKQGFVIEIHTSRARTCEGNLVGLIARTFSVWQCWLNGAFLRKKHFCFYADDNKKINAIIKRQPMVVFDDKRQIIEQLAEKGVKIICICGLHNGTFSPSKNIETLDQYDEGEIERKIEALVGKANLECHRKENLSARFFSGFQG